MKYTLQKQIEGFYFITFESMRYQLEMQVFINYLHIYNKVTIFYKLTLLRIDCFP